MAATNKWEYRRDVRWCSFFGHDIHKGMKNRDDLFSEKVANRY